MRFCPVLVLSLTLLALAAPKGADANLLPTDAQKIDFTFGTASADSLWYSIGGAQREIFLPQSASGETFRDLDLGLKYSRGFAQDWDATLGINWVKKSHLASSGATIREKSELGYATLTVRRAALQREWIDSTVYLEERLPFERSSPWVYTSSNDRAFHTALGVQAGVPLPARLTLFADQKVIARSHGRPPQYEGTAGLSFQASPVLTFSPFYFVHWTFTGSNCNHSPASPSDFHNRPYAANLMDRHQGPGASLAFNPSPSQAILGGFLGIEAFGYYKIDGINTDRSFTLGINLSYARL